MPIIITIIILSIILYFSFTFFLSTQTLKLKRQPIVKTPKDYDMNYEDIDFKTSDDVTIKGWLLPKPESEKLVVFVHVGSFNRHGLIPENQGLFKLYDKEVEMLKTAKNFHDKGYSILLFDLRNHGESGDNPNKGMVTIGLDESLDVIGALNYIKSREDLKNKDIHFVSFCTGANSAIIAMSREKELFKDVKSLVAIQAVSMDVFNRTYLKRMMTVIGSKIIMPGLRFFVKLRTGHSTTEMSPMEYVKDIPCPVLYIQAKNDPWTELSDVQGFYEKTSGFKELVYLEDTAHRFDSYRYFEDKPEMILDWVGKYK